MTTLWPSSGGLHLIDYKHESLQLQISQLPIPKRLILALQQHIGYPSKPVVTVGDTVFKGQLIAQSGGAISARLHAPTSGEIVALDSLPIPHPSRLSAPCITIESDGHDRWQSPPKFDNDYFDLPPTSLIQRIQDAGVTGLGGASFPTHVKLNPSIKARTLILNAAECEPYITCDDILMQTRATELIAGLHITLLILQIEKCIIGIEDNKPQALAALQHALAPSKITKQIKIVSLPTRYPAGSEKQLIFKLTGLEVPSHGIPPQIGVVCHNVATIYAIYRAVAFTEPFISRLVTVTGACVTHPQNIEVPLGSPISELIHFAGGLKLPPQQLIMGGPMMGVSLQNDTLPTVKATNCIVALAPDEMYSQRTVRACIRCGACAEVCPMRLLPQQLYWYARAKAFEHLQDVQLFDCIECGCCNYACPSHIPLVHYFRYAKGKIKTQISEKTKSERAHYRNSVRMQRLARKKTERDEKFRKKKAAIHQPTGVIGDKSVIDLAVERVQTKRNRNSSIDI